MPPMTTKIKPIDASRNRTPASECGEDRCTCTPNICRRFVLPLPRSRRGSGRLAVVRLPAEPYRVGVLREGVTVTFGCPEHPSVEFPTDSVTGVHVLAPGYRLQVAAGLDQPHPLSAELLRVQPSDYRLRRRCPSAWWPPFRFKR